MPRFRPMPFLVVAAGGIALLGGLALSRPVPAEAHPLGNFTVNRYSRLELFANAVRVRYIVDMAEIPAFQEKSEIDTDGDDGLSASEDETYLAKKSKEIVDKLELLIGGSDVEPDIISAAISHPEGQAGLPTLRIALLLAVPVSGSEVQIAYRDGNYADRIGWKEIVVRPAAGIALSSSTAATDDVSAELTAYPDDLLSSPLDVTSANVVFVAGAGENAPPVEGVGNEEASPTARSRGGEGFASLVNIERLTVPVIALSLILALGFGAIHALEPGHGKTLVAAYFVGVKGTARQAVALGLIVAATHTVGVLIIGLIALFGSQYILPERLYPYLSLASGLMILALGVRLLAARTRGWLPVRKFLAVVRRDPRQGHDLHHEQGHEHLHGLQDAPPWKGLIALGLADGLTPSPSALIVLLAAISLDRIPLGVMLIMSFSVGLALVLTCVCLALVYARTLFDWIAARRKTDSVRTGVAPDALLKLAPLGGAVALFVVGVVLTARALAAPGVAVF